VGARYGESEVPRAAGVPTATMANQVTIPHNDIALVERTLAEDRNIAAIILEPSGASWGTMPLVSGFLAELREVSQRHEVLLIFDEVVTGFRLSTGGAQKLYGVTPDLTCLAKILGGGLPGGAVRVFHPGTFNANPLSAAAGVAMLSHIADGEPQAHADAMARRLVPAMNQALARREIPGCVYGLSSLFHIVLGKDCPRPRDGIGWPWDAANGAPPPRTDLLVALTLKQGCLNNGIDLMGFDGGIISAVHQPADIDATIEAFDKTLAQMQEEGIL